jgi:hypothetical protein
VTFAPPVIGVAAIATQFATLLAFVVVVVLPAVTVAVCLLDALPVLHRVALGAATGYGMFVIALAWIGSWSLDGAWAVWFAQAIGAVWVLVRAVRRCGPWQVSWTPSAFVVLLPLLAGGAVHLYSLRLSELPQGVDPAFHCVVAQRQIDAGRATQDMRPLEDLTLNYPIGAHLWLAVASRWTGLPVHAVFRHSFVWAIVGAGLCVAAWAERLFGSRSHAVAASFAFVFGSFQASLFPYTWGGLPSALAMCLAVAGLYAACAVPGPAGVAIAAVLIGAMTLVHHHTMIAMLGALAIATGALAIRGGRATAMRLAATAVGGAALAAIYVVPLLGRVGEVRGTGMIEYAEPFAWPWEHAWSWGPGLVVTALTGFAAAVPPDQRPARRLLLLVMAVWLAVFVALDYGGRAGLLMRGVSSTPFTPSRFLFDVQFILAIFAGAGIVQWRRWLRSRALTGLALAAMACWAVWATTSRLNRLDADMLVGIGRWIDRNLPRDSVVLTPNSAWLTYVCHRETASLFIPISEPGSSPRRMMKQGLLRFSPNTRWSAVRQQLGKRVYAIGAAGADYADPPLHVIGPLAVVELKDADE